MKMSETTSEFVWEVGRAVVVVQTLRIAAAMAMTDGFFFLSLKSCYLSIKSPEKVKSAKTTILLT
jgi:hypothetical protein